MDRSNLYLEVRVLKSFSVGRGGGTAPLTPGGTANPSGTGLSFSFLFFLPIGEADWEGR